MTRFCAVRHHTAAKSRPACAVLQVISANKCRAGFAETIQRERPPGTTLFGSIQYSRNSTPIPTALGARHNADQCFLCRAQPTLSGSGGFLVPNPGQGTLMLPENPMFRLVPNRFGKQNVVPVFEQQFGPIREVRFKYNPDGTRDRGVHQLWVVTGIKTDPTLTNCSLKQPDFASQLKAGNLSFRIPLQMLRLGPDRFYPDRELLSYFKATASERAALGIAGHPNRSGNDGTIKPRGHEAGDIRQSRQHQDVQDRVIEIAGRKAIGTLEAMRLTLGEQLRRSGAVVS